jgi:arginyl-tRNA--protein-N-Asp/Glu arginylyltransferase
MKRIIHPTSLTPEALDEYLAAGWFRVSQTLMTCRAIMTRQALRSTVWTRIDLQNFQFKKSLRRVMRRVESSFDVVISRATLDQRREDLYQRYLTFVDGSRAETLYKFLYDDGDNLGLFDTWEVSIWNGNDLIAFSWFDLGAQSAESLIGVFEPEFAAYGLGLYTMLRELQFTSQTGRRFFYPGYVLPGDPSMDYKLRPGHVWFLDDRTNHWHPWSTFTTSDYKPPIDRLAHTLSSARSALAAAGVPSKMLVNPMFEIPAHVESLSMCLSQPLVLDCFPDRTQPRRLMVTWCFSEQAFLVLHCLWVIAKPTNDASRGLTLLLVEGRRCVGPNLSDAVEEVWCMSTEDPPPHDLL